MQTLSVDMALPSAAHVSFGVLDVIWQAAEQLGVAAHCSWMWAILPKPSDLSLRVMVPVIPM